MDQDRAARIAEGIDASVPQLIADCAVAVVRVSESGAVIQIGSGTLLAVADARFVVTAAHVASEAASAPLGIAALRADQTQLLLGSWLLTASQAASDDKYDIAVYRLSDRELEHLNECRFARLSDLDFGSDLATGYFVMCGFPSIWSIASATPSSQLILRPIIYGVFPYEGSTVGLANFDPNIHLLFQASPEYLLDPKGQPATIRTRANQWVGMPGALRGISGCSVWMIGNTSVNPSNWARQPARLVAVETSVYETSIPSMKATRSRAVLSILYENYADLRQAIELHVR